MSKPFAFICEFYADPGKPFLSFEPIRSGTNTPLYKNQAKLTDEDIIECENIASIQYRRHMASIRGQQLSPSDNFLWHFARAVENQLKEKNGYL